MYSVTYLYQYEFLVNYFILWVIMQYYITFVQIVPALAIVASFSWLRCPFIMPSIVYVYVWAFWYCKMLHAYLILYISCPSPRNSPGILVLVLQVLYIYIYKKAHTHIHVYIHILDMSSL